MIPRDRSFPRRPKVPWWIFLLLLTPAGESSAFDGGWQAGIGGGFKSILNVEKLRQENLYTHDYVPFAEQRLRLNASFSNDWLRAEVADELSYFYQRYPGPKVPMPRVSGDGSWKGEWHLVDNAENDLYNRIDRAFLQLTFGDFETIVGRQVVPTGVGRLFAAISQVPRHPFVAVDTEYEKTEDAVAVTWRGPFVVEGRFLPKVGAQKEHNFHLRTKTNLADYDVAITMGRSDDKPYAGVECAGNIGDSLIRGELVAYSHGGKAVWQGLAGYDHFFSAKWSAQMELFYNGFGKRAPYRIEPFGHRSAPYRGQWYFGGTLGWEATPRLKASAGSLVNILDPSTLLHFQVAYSFSENVDFLIGQYLNAGSSEREFGGKLARFEGDLVRTGVPDLSYALMKYAF